jgi:hypothetical protein
VPHPVASSVSQEVWRRMPNDSDFTVFNRHQFRGLNFAHLGGWPAYHTPLRGGVRRPPRVPRVGCLPHTGCRKTPYQTGSAAWMSYGHDNTATNLLGSSALASDQLGATPQAGRTGRRGQEPAVEQREPTRSVPFGDIQRRAVMV